MGVGQTQNLIDNLPSGRCAIVVFNSNESRSIKERIKEQHGTDFAKNIKFFVISSQDDISKMAGYSYLVFFDHSFLQNASEDVAKEAYSVAHSCAVVSKHGSSK